jgi:hypothetical protein
VLRRGVVIFVSVTCWFQDRPVGTPPYGYDRGMPGRRPYFVLMGICLVLIVCAWTWVRLLSTPAAVAMSVVAMAIPPFASMTANAGREGGPATRRWFGRRLPTQRKDVPPRP